jgi:biotin transport system substrate-specific component
VLAVKQTTVSLDSVGSEALKVLVAAAALAVSARLAFALPGSPVPVTAQTLAVLLVGAMLGPRRGVLAVGVYLLCGLAGLPVFAAGGGPAYLLSPTAGYLLGFLPAAFLAGYLLDPRRPWTALPAMLAADAVLFACGLAVLSLHLPARHLLGAGLVCFLPGETLKIMLASIILRVRA